MTRLPRFVLPGQPQHVIQRGNNRDAIFCTEEDYRFYLEKLAAAAAKHDCAIHAYVLMTNHVHLLLTLCVNMSSYTECVRYRRFQGHGKRSKGDAEGAIGTAGACRHSELGELLRREGL